MEEKKETMGTRPFEGKITQQVSLNKSQSQDIIKWILNYKEELDEYRRELRGEIKTGDGWIVDEEKRSLNDLGVSEIMKRLKLVYSKGAVLSFMTDEDIRKDATEFNIQLCFDCYAHTPEWGFKTYTDRSSIITLTSLLYFKLLLRSKNALQLKQLSESIERQEKVMYGDRSGMKDENQWWKFWQGKKN